MKALMTVSTTGRYSLISRPPSSSTRTSELDLSLVLHTPTRQEMAANLISPEAWDWASRAWTMATWHLTKAQPAISSNREMQSRLERPPRTKSSARDSPPKKKQRETVEQLMVEKE